MFLKRIQLQGFKSFADKTIINFENEVSGIVGPNGCGKSNVNDAIRWVLGEQSAKSLRGGSMSDVIFSGSAKRKAVNMAEVTLVFDNSRHNFNVDFEEVSITRRLFRNSGDAEYLINNTPCRLRDINELVMDSGLGKDSLSVISQGNITEFVESKPEDRRGLFEEAAGVSKYKKRKHESVNKLNRTEDNLLRIEDIIEELEKRVNPLRRQAKKAEKYIALKDELESIEIHVIVDEVNQLTNELEQLKQKKFDIESKKAINETQMNLEETNVDSNKKMMSSLDKEIHELQSQFMNVVNKISSLEARKSELDEKRRYMMEYASNQEKIKQLKAMLKEAEYEYHDRESRLEKMNVDYDLNNQNIHNLQDDLQQIKQRLYELNTHINKLSNRKEVLENLSKSPFQHQEGVKNVLRANLYGVCGALSQLVIPKSGYEDAISYALGGAIYNIVCDDSNAAKQAINYLKKNRGGRATFLPLNVLKPRYVNDDDYDVSEQVEGFLGISSDFVDYDDKYEVLVKSLLGNVLVCKNIDSANELAKLLKYRYKIVTLDGDIVHKGGSMSGGENKKQSSPITITKELKEVNQKLNKYLEEKEVISKKSDKLSIEYNKLKETSEELKLGIAKLEPLVNLKKSKYEKLKDEYASINPNDDEDNSEDISDELVVELSNVQMQKDQIENELNLKRERRFELGQKVEKKEVLIKQLRRELNSLINEEKTVEIQIAKNETKIDEVLNRLSSSYEMTYEHAKTLVNEEIDLQEAREKVLYLRNEISKLGNVNLDAPEEFKEVNERYELLTSQKEELMAAKNKILDAISEMDEVMGKQFLEMFNKINAELDGTFKQLFGGGSASLRLVNPDDILNTGIEVEVHPPGKNIKNMQQLSGGEKAMLALCVLFSIMKARVMPLCIFDEVEAALDQANVERFAKYIGNFKGESQFIVVTHRPGTMSQCDELFGVTMHQDGVSKILNVKLNEAMNYVNERKEA